MKKIEVPDDVAKAVETYLAMRAEGGQVVERVRVDAGCAFMVALRAGNVRIPSGAR